MIVNGLSANRVWDCLDTPEWWGRAMPMPKDIAELGLIEAEILATKDPGIHGLRLRIHAHIASEGKVILPPSDRTHPEGIRLLKAYHDTRGAKSVKPKIFRSLKAEIARVR